MALAWLLEKDGEDFVYLIAVDSGYFGWSSDVNKAFRMSREKDAIALSGIVNQACHVVEHEWVGE